MRTQQLSPVVLTLCLSLICSSALATTHTVTSTGDASTGGTLRWAINA